jgi:tRNA uridine 5-carboxymethylaminomethyl modification enzyme
LNIERIRPEQQRSCWIAYTNQTVHDTLKTGFDKSPMYAGRIEGTGPRYCPSIEDKINRFAERDRHQLFVEPEGWSTVEIYLNGFSTSLPEDVQYKSLVKIPGFENVKMFRPGYAIEYDYFPPHQLHYSLETKQLRGLFFAGQINGTTGYEEAACQGLMAGMNAHNNAFEREPLVLKRSEAYIGVLIDDLITKGTEEPYRMFTSRAEFRTLLRQDNADIRLTEIGYQQGLASEERYQQVKNKKDNVDQIIKKFSEVSVEPESMNAFFEAAGSAALTQKQKISQLVLRPGIGAKEMIEHSAQLKTEFGHYAPLEIEQAEIQMKYAVYLEKEREMVHKMAQMEELEIPQTFDYTKVQAIGTEAREKLKKIQPKTLGQASRISGINPSDVQILMVYMGR